MKNHTLSVLLALAGIAATSAYASTVTSTAGDLILGFRSTSSTNNLEIDLGTASSLTTSGFQANIGAALTSFDSGWATDANLLFGMAGTTSSSSNPDLFASTPESAAGTVASTSLVPHSGTTQKNGKAGIIPIYTGLNGATAYTGLSTTAVISASAPNSWSLAEGSSSATSFGYFTPAIDGNASVFSTYAFGSKLDGSNYAVLDLYQLTHGTSSPTLLGAIGLNSSGNLEFQIDPTQFGAASPVPEPSTYAAVLGAVTLGFVAIRRRRQARA
jgi:hypothetical protein